MISTTTTTTTTTTTVLLSDTIPIINNKRKYDDLSSSPISGIITNNNDNNSNTFNLDFDSVLSTNVATSSYTYLSSAYICKHVTWLVKAELIKNMYYIGQSLKLSQELIHKAVYYLDQCLLQFDGISAKNSNPLFVCSLVTDNLDRDHKRKWLAAACIYLAGKMESRNHYLDSHQLAEIFIQDNNASPQELADLARDIENRELLILDLIKCGAYIDTSFTVLNRLFLEYLGKPTLSQYCNVFMQCSVLLNIFALDKRALDHSHTCIALCGLFIVLNNRASVYTKALNKMKNQETLLPTEEFKKCYSDMVRFNVPKLYNEDYTPVFVGPQFNGNGNGNNLNLAPAPALKVESSANILDCHWIYAQYYNPNLFPIFTDILKKEYLSPEEPLPCNVPNLHRSVSPFSKELKCRFSDPKKLNLQPVGKGGFGNVFLVTHESTTNMPLRKSIALKVSIEQTNARDGGLDPSIVRELAAFAHLGDNDNIVKVYGIKIEPETFKVWIEMDAYSLTVTKLINNTRTFFSNTRKTRKDAKHAVEPIITDKNMIKTIFRGIVNGLYHMHRNGRSHRDLTPDNVLLDDSDPNNLIPKIIDMGLSQTSNSHNNMLSPNVTMHWYRAPELLFAKNPKDYNPSAIDIWALGVIFSFLLTLRPIFYGETCLEVMSSLIAILGNPTVQEIPALASLGFTFQPVKPAGLQCITKDVRALDLISKMLVYDATKRITCLQVLQHPYFRDD
jgi:hypothetical protein